MVKLKDILENTKVIERSHEWPSEKTIKEDPKPLEEVSPKTLDRAGKMITYLVKYYGLKVNNIRQAVSDLARFL
jgi:transketolase C-terminal domain/subunit